MFLGNLVQEAEAAVAYQPYDERWPDAEPGYFGFLHHCVDGSHQWCHEWEGNTWRTRTEAVMEVYGVLLEDERGNLAMEYWYSHPGNHY